MQKKEEKLTLKTETVRRLGRADLRAVAGGIAISYPFACTIDRIEHMDR